MQTDVINEIQTALRRLHFTDSRLPPIIPNGIFNAQTEQAVRIFQRTRGLFETGIVDADTFYFLTQEAIESDQVPLSLDLFEGDPVYLKKGSTDPRIPLIQSLINLASSSYQNLPTVPVSGIYDSDTVLAVQTIQRLHNLNETGDLDTSAWNSLVRLFHVRPLLGSDLN